MKIAAGFVLGVAASYALGRCVMTLPEVAVYHARFIEGRWEPRRVA